MPQFFLNKRLIILLVSIIILVSLIGFSLRERENISKPEQFVKDVVGFGQSLVSKPAHAVAGFFENIHDLQNTYTENKKLKARMEELTKLESEVNDLKKDNKELRKVLDKKENLRGFTTIQATVISRNSDRWYENVIIDKGKNQGVEKNMAIMTSNGLIGKVINVSALTSTVELLSADNSKNRISAMIQGGKKGDGPIYGSVEGYDKEKKVLMMRGLRTDLEIKPGEQVISSGLGGVFPHALPIGKVKELVPDQYGLTQMAYIEPDANFYDLEHVMVIKRSMPVIDSEDMNGGEEKK